MALLSRLRLAEIYMSQGALHRAYDIYEQAVRCATDAQGEPLPLAGPAIAGLGNVLFAWGDDRAAREQIEQALVFGTLLGIDAVRVECYLTFARIRQGQGDITGAHAALDQVEQIARPWNSPATLVRIGAFRTRVWLAQGDVAAASRWASGYDAARAAAAQGMIETLTLLRVRIAQFALDREERHLQQAETLLAHLLGLVEGRGQWVFAIELYVQQARLLHLRGESEQALVVLERAVGLAADERVCRPFVEEGPQLYALLAALARRPGSARLRAFVQQLDLSLAYEEPDSAMAVVGSSPKPLLGEPLTERERAVLRLVVAGLQDKEIAQELVVSLNTIRYHTKNIYRKLQVRSRSRAIAQAARLGIG
ncbi:hypothetical protein SD80_012085 [Scytonema tolypothrichoides VB-61278]|nr:hypothetical protein SD80_012085 [Scytonema tolypothrichoides VB-61278]